MAAQGFPKHLDANELRDYGNRQRLANHPRVFGNAGQSSENQGRGGQGHSSQGRAGHWNDLPSENEAADDFAPPCIQDFSSREILSKDVESNETLPANPESRDPRPDGDPFFNCLGFLSFGDPHPGIPDWTLEGDGFSLQGPPPLCPCSADDRAPPPPPQRKDCLDYNAMTSYADMLKDTGQPSSSSSSSSNSSIPDPVDRGTDVRSNSDLLHFVALEIDYQDMDDDENPEKEKEEEEEEEEENMAAQEEPVEEFYKWRESTPTNDDDDDGGGGKRRQEDRRNILRQTTTTDRAKGAKQTTTTTKRERVATKSPTLWRPILPKPNPIVLIEQRQVTASAEDVMAAELRHKRRFWRCCSESFSDYNLYKIHIEGHGVVDQQTALMKAEQKKRKRTTTSPTAAGRTKNYRALAAEDRAGLLVGRAVCLYCGSDCHADVTRTPGFSADDRTCPQCRKPYKTLYCLRRHYCVKHNSSRQQNGGDPPSSGKPGSTPAGREEEEEEEDSSVDDECESGAEEDERMSPRSSSPRSTEELRKEESASFLSSLFSSTESWL